MKKTGPNLGGPIDPRTASPTEYLRYLQNLAARQSSARGSWRSIEISDALRDRTTLEDRLDRDVAEMIQASDLEGEERERLLKVFAERREEILAVQIPTGVIGNPAFYMVVTDLVRDVEHAVARLGYEVPEKVTFGALPTGQINGLACAVPSGGLIVALDDGVFTFFNLVAKAVATFYKVEHLPDGGGAFRLIEDDIPRAVAMSQEGNRRWLEVLTATFVYGHPELAPPWPASDNKAIVIDSFLTPSEMFIVAHEFAHLILGHYESDRPTSRHRMLSGEEVESVNTLRSDEFEADRIGLEILREHYSNIGVSVENTRWTVRFIHGCLNTLALNGIESAPVDTSTHPTPEERTGRLLQQLTEEESISADTVVFTDSVYEVMRCLFFHNLDRFIEWRELALNGTPPWSLTPRPSDGTNSA